MCASVYRNVAPIERADQPSPERLDRGSAALRDRAERERLLPDDRNYWLYQPQPIRRGIKRCRGSNAMIRDAKRSSARRTFAPRNKSAKLNEARERLDVDRPRSRRIQVIALRSSGSTNGCGLFVSGLILTLSGIVIGERRSGRQARKRQLSQSCERERAVAENTRLAAAVPPCLNPR